MALKNGSGQVAAVNGLLLRKNINGEISIAKQGALLNDGDILTLITGNAYAKFLNGFPTILQISKPIILDGISPLLKAATKETLLEHIIEEAIKKGIDPSVILEALEETAAGEGGSLEMNEGSDFIILNPLYSLGGVAAGYPTKPINQSFNENIESSFLFKPNDSNHAGFNILAEPDQTESNPPEPEPPEPALINNLVINVHDDALASGITENQTQTSTQTVSLTSLFNPSSNINFEWSGNINSLPKFTVQGNDVLFSVKGDTLSAEVNIKGQIQTVFTFTLNDDGTLTKNLLMAIDHPNANNDDSEIFSFDLSPLIRAIFNGGDSIILPPSTVLVNIEDDVPIAIPKPGTVTTSLDESALMPEGDGVYIATIPANKISDLFETPKFGADENGTVTYSLKAVDDAPTGLWFTGESAITEEIRLIKVSDDQYEGRRGGDGGKLAFTVQINNTTGEVTVTLANDVALHHPDASNHDDALTLANSAAIHVVQTVTDGDGDSTSATSTNPLQISFEDDGPALDITANDNVLLLDESTGGAPNENDETLSTDLNDIGYAKLNASELFTLNSNAGADGEQSLSFQLVVNDNDSGLIETATGDAIVLSANENGTEVYGQNSSDGLVFKIVINPNTGDVEVFQYSAIVHDNPSDPDEADTPKTLAQDALSLKATLIDGDDDIAEDSFDLGQLIHFEDDGPAISVAVNDDNSIVLNTQDADTIGNASDTATASFAAAFSIDGSSYGSDGAGSIDWNYQLNLMADAPLNSTMTSGGQAIYLYEVDGNIIGSTASDQNDINTANTVFSLSVDAGTGDVTLTQMQEIDHPLPGDNANYSQQSLALNTGLIALTAEVIITDGDNDTAIDSQQLDLGGNLIFDDDGPALDITASDNVLLLDESTGGAPNENDETLSTDLNDIGYAKLNASELFTLNSNAGADGEQSLSFQLVVNDNDSGLIETATGDAIVLSANENGTEVYGQNSSDGLVFKIVINPNTGDVEVFQYSAIAHDDPSDPDEADTPKTLAQDALSFKATLIDGDGDIAKDSFDLGQLIHFEDDGPVAQLELNGNTVTLDESIGIDNNDPNAHTDDDISNNPFPAAYGTPIGLISDVALVEGSALFGSDGPAITPTTDAGSEEAPSAGDETAADEAPAAAPRAGAEAEDAASAALDDRIEIEETASAVDGVEVEAEEVDSTLGDVRAEVEDALSAVDRVEAEAEEVVEAGAEAEASPGAGADVAEEAPTTPGAEAEAEDENNDSLPDSGGTATDSIPSIQYALNLTQGEGSDSGLKTTTGTSIHLYLEDNGDVTGRAGSSTDSVAFAIRIDETTGKVTVAQYLSLQHPDAPENDDEAINLSGKLDIVITATDGDGDQNSNSIDIGANIRFEDDGPAISVAVNDDNSIVLNTQDADTIGNASDTATASFAAAFSIDSSSYGSDGAGSIDWNYQLDLMADAPLNSTMTSGGQAIYLYEVDGNIIGSTASDQNAINTANTIFSLSVDAGTGDVTLTQMQEIDHPLPGDNANYSQQSLALNTGLIALTAEAIITDGDNDTAIDSQQLDLGGNLIFDDDGPALDITASDNVLLLDESTGGAPNENDETLSTDPNDIGYAKLNASELFTLSTNNPGADGEQSLSFQLVVNDNDSGLIETATGDAIVLSANENGTEVYGQNSSDGLVFKIVIDPSTGDVEVFQYSAIAHDNPSDPDEADTPKTLAQDALSLKATLIDGDGDIAKDSFDLGQLIHFEDDGPVINADPPDNFEPWQSPDISHITLYWRQADDGHLEDTRGNGKDPDGWFTVKIDNYRGSPDLDDEIGRILDFLVSEEVIEESDKDNLVGVAIKGGQQELWYDYDTANSDPNSDPYPNDIPDFPIEKNELDMTYAWGDVLASGIPPSNTSSQQTITLDENDLSEENSLVSFGQIDISYGSDGVGGLTLSDSGAPDGYTYTLNQNATVLTVRDHETNTDVMKISIINAATGEYEVELLSPLTHPTSEDILSFNIGFTATDGDGDAVRGSFGINVINDGHPVAFDNKANVDEPSDYLNIYFVLDVSGSMGWKIDPVTGETIYSWWGPIEGSPNRLELAKEALVNLTEQYSNINGEALITVVPFSSGRGDNGAFASQTFNVLTPAGLQAAKDFINELDVGEGPLGTGTEYNDALNITREQLEADLANSALDNYENKVYFLSDGMPSPNAEAPASWQGFVDGNNIDVIPVGIGDFDTGGLVAVGNSGDEIIQVINPNELSAILENQISHIATGNVVTDLNSHGEIDTYGEDGHAAGTPLVISIEHNGVTYQFGDYSQNTDGHYVATIETELDGQLIFNFSTGDYQYTAPVVSGDNEEKFEYTIQDADGDTASAFLTICIHDTSPPEFIVGTNVDDQGTSDTAYAVGDGKGTITGDGAGDILVGDTGGQEQTGKVANLAFVLDVSGSMNDNLGDSNQSKLDVLKTTMSNFLTQLSETENAAIRVHIVPFASIALAPQTFDISSGELTSALNYIEALEANGGTNYEAALGTANNWFSDPSHLLANADFQQTIFLTDGLPTLYTDGDSTDYTNENKVFGHGQHVEKVLIENLYGNHEGEEVTRDILNNIGETDSRDLDGRQDYVYDQDDDDDFETIPTTSDFIESVPDTYSEVDALKAHGPLRAISLENSEATTYLNNIDSEGQAYQVGSQELLQEILNDLSPLNSLNAAGDDRIIGTGGDDIIFGDSLYTDLLADNEGLNMPDGYGWAVFEELENNHADWNRQDTIDYINNHSDELAQQTVLPNGSGRAGGNDYIEGGAGNDHIYSQEGADTVDGGSGNNTIDLGIDSDADALIFNIETLDGNNTIINFDKNVDYLHFENVLTENSGGNIDDLDSLLAPENAFENTGPNNEDLTVNFQNGASITFVGVGLDASTMNSMQDITPNIVVNEISI
ncbi:VWA domain-containing protein [Legionella israelensis]|uniref:DUF5801 repeats-in-toxin domain-containing protein n=1 Tax=Legionella israelensis TaxID=454 RepID=UPI00117CBF98|nr:DUF5801 repeats-in-toxin domain-containing protein [Legionella israelensis]QDP72987.1 VWA domain-containing protein [Legionella israelensis]